MRYIGAMSDVTNELILEHLKRMHQDIHELKSGQDGLRETVNHLRAEFHSHRGDQILQENRIFMIERDVQRIKQRLEIVDEHDQH